MSSRLPPVPADNQSHKGTGEPGTIKASQPAPSDVNDNPDKKGQSGNSKVNTTHQGYQQDR